MTQESADSWKEIPASSDEFVDSPGDYLNNWKTRGYSTILDILMVCISQYFK